jgi:hypothetical protein
VIYSAQKQGFLSDPIASLEGINETAEADPFYAACKLHTNRETSKRRAKSYAILQEQLRVKAEQKQEQNLTDIELNNQSRIRRKLERIRFKVAIKQAHSFVPPVMGYSSPNNNKPFGSSNNVQIAHYYPDDLLGNNNSSSSSLVPYNFHFPQQQQTLLKKARLLSTSAGSASNFVHKAKLMGLDIPSLELEDKHARIVGSVKKKWNVLPSMSVEFAAYYADREIRIKSLNEQCEVLAKNNYELCESQNYLQDSYEISGVNIEAMGEDTDRVRDELCGLGATLKAFIASSASADKDGGGVVDKVISPKLFAKLNGMVGDFGSGGGGRRRSVSSQGKGGGRNSVSPPKSIGKKVSGMKRGSGGAGGRSPTGK